MASSTVHIEREIQEQQRRLVDEFAELKSLAATAMDWRTHVRQHLMLSCGLAAAAGMMLARHSAPERLHALQANGSRDGNGQVRDEYHAASPGPGPLSVFASAIVPVVTRALLARLEGDIQEHSVRGR